MGMFDTRKPRSYQHTFIYADRHKDYETAVREKFREQVGNRQRRHTSGRHSRPMRTTFLLLLIAALLCLWFALGGHTA